MTMQKKSNHLPFFLKDHMYYQSHPHESTLFPHAHTLLRSHGAISFYCTHFLFSATPSKIGFNLARAIIIASSVLTVLLP